MPLRNAINASLVDQVFMTMLGGFLADFNGKRSARGRGSGIWREPWNIQEACFRSKYKDQSAPIARRSS